MLFLSLVLAVWGQISPAPNPPCTARTACSENSISCLATTLGTFSFQCGNGDGGCLDVVGCVFCPKDNTCVPGATFNTSACKQTDELAFFQLECDLGLSAGDIVDRNILGGVGVMSVLGMLWMLVTCPCRPHKMSEGMGQWYKDHFVVDIDFSHVALEKFRPNACGFLVARFSCVAYFLVLLSDVYVVFVAFARSFPFGLAYFLVVLLSFFVLAVDAYRARQILASDDISDCFLHPEAYRWKTTRDPVVFGFFQQVTRKFNWRDRLLNLAVETYHSSGRLLFVNLPQLFLSFLLLSSASTQKCKQQGVSVCTETVFEQGRYYFLVLLIMFLSYSLFKLLFFVFIGPCICCCTDRAEMNLIEGYRRWDHKLRAFCTYKIDKRINELVRERGAFVKEVFDYSATHKMTDPTPASHHQYTCPKCKRPMEVPDGSTIYRCPQLGCKQEVELETMLA